ncbi:MAG: bifunctional diaminohydroxyphosphoribosylaminopyrimidine deaminase/5-amino-6-(5-phosphoribosylamino)uracil reductase RibD, partial [Pseudomonadota bacterium]
MKTKGYRVRREAEYYMAQALRSARRGLGRTDPNPMVGAVVCKDGVVIGEGYHQAAGRPHAEVEALRGAGEKARGADLYVTLEPCNHHGRTPPCTRAIIEAGIARVWYGMADPNPAVSGGGVHALRAGGIEVEGPILEDHCVRLNEVFITHVTLRRPFVFLKLAMSLDGRIATRTGQSRWITSESSRRRVHLLRDRVSAIMVGIGTVLADNPALTTRLDRGKGRDPIRIVVDSALRTNPEAAIFNPSSTSGVIVATRSNPPEAPVRGLEAAGAEVVRTEGRDRVDLQDLMTKLYDRGITSVLVEGGAGLAWGALDAGIVDRCLFFYAPKIIGGMEAPSGIGGLGIATLDKAPHLEGVEVARVGTDI